MNTGGGPRSHPPPWRYFVGVVHDVGAALAPSPLAPATSHRCGPRRLRRSHRPDAPVRQHSDRPRLGGRWLVRGDREHGSAPAGAGIRLPPRRRRFRARWYSAATRPVGLSTSQPSWDSTPARRRPGGLTAMALLAAAITAAPAALVVASAVFAGAVRGAPLCRWQRRCPTAGGRSPPPGASIASICRSPAPPRSAGSSVNCWHRRSARTGARRWRSPCYQRSPSSSPDVADRSRPRTAENSARVGRTARWKSCETSSNLPLAR